VDEARDYFRTPIPEAFAHKLARRAEAVFAHHPFWQRKFEGRFRRSQTAVTGREAILMSMRHWLAGVLAKERPALFRALPENFKVGHPLPEYRGRAPSPLRAANTEEPASHPTRRAQSDAPYLRFVHGCELLPV
jgi:hypothetical protein